MVTRLISKAVCKAVGTVFDWIRPGFPETVRVETTNACNARCVICPHQSMERAVQRMDDPLYERIVDECAEGGCREMHLHNFGEPLLDRHLEDPAFDYAKQAWLAACQDFFQRVAADRNRLHTGFDPMPDWTRSRSASTGQPGGVRADSLSAASSTA